MKNTHFVIRKAIHVRIAFHMGTAQDSKINQYATQDLDRTDVYNALTVAHALMMQAVIWKRSLVDVQAMMIAPQVPQFAVGVSVCSVIC